MSYINTDLSIFVPGALDFEPVLKPIVYNNRPVLDKKLVVRTDTDEPLGVVGSKHRPTPYAKLWEPLVKGLADSDLDLTEATVKWNVIDRGGAMFADITLKAYDYEHIVGEPTRLSMRVVNSVNGKYKYLVSSFLRRLACLNGMTRMADDTSTAFKHTAGTDPEKIGEVASKWPALLEHDAHLFNHMKTVHLTDEDVSNLFAKFCITVTRTETRVNKAWLGRMVNLWDTYKTGIGKNGFALYNALTHYSTHADKDMTRGDLNAKLLRQEQSVSKFINGGEFKKLINYDNFDLKIAA